jgi:hypothetical protein
MQIWKTSSPTTEKTSLEGEEPGSLTSMLTAAVGLMVEEKMSYVDYSLDDRRRIGKEFVESWGTFLPGAEMQLCAVEHPCSASVCTLSKIPRMTAATGTEPIPQVLLRSNGSIIDFCSAPMQAGKWFVRWRETSHITDT